MGLKGGLLGGLGDVAGALFGGGRNVVAETAEVFRANADAADARDAAQVQAALAQLSAEMARLRPGLYDRVIDGLNRLPRPALALGTVGLMVSAMVAPAWFAERMAGLALVPEPLWWLLGAIVSFYFGARHQAKGQEFQRAIAQTMALVAQMRGGMAPGAGPAAGAETGPAAGAGAGAGAGANAALREWRAGAG